MQVNQDLDLRFTLGYKGYTDINRVASSVRDFTLNNTGRFVDEFSTFDKLKCAFGAFNFTKPTDIIPAL